MNISHVDQVHWKDNSTCGNHSCIHGSCISDVCVCEVKFTGNACMDLNEVYFIGFAIFFYLISAVAFLQLVFCVRKELQQMARPRFSKACRMTIQKLLYLYIIFAAGSRGAYFTSELLSPLHPKWTMDLFTVYYPFVICSFAALIFFWAEAFHVSGWTVEKFQFLNKYSQVFVVFNIVTFTVTLGQIIATNTVKDSRLQMLLVDIFSGYFVFLMFAVLIFFLIYGIEIFCKVQGAFASELYVVNWSQLIMSRFGLVAQTIFQLSAAIFLLWSLLQRKWKYSTGVESKNAFEIVARISELAVALWFPCVLWNCVKPKELWILNPRKIIKTFEEEADEEETTVFINAVKSYNSISGQSVRESTRDCWICYDVNRKDAGPMIFPCQCKGDVAAAHQECLKRWLMELSLDSCEAPSCKVCKTKYTIKETRGFASACSALRHYGQALVIIMIMLGVAVGTYRLCDYYKSTLLNIASIGLAILCECGLFRWLGYSFITAYHRARLASIVVLGREAHQMTS